VAVLRQRGQWVVVMSSGLKLVVVGVGLVGMSDLLTGELVFDTTEESLP
jgi:hypothetical protein